MSADTGSGKKPEVFVRKSSGLVRTAGVWDVLAYNMNFTSIGLLLLFLILFGPAFYPGIDMSWSTIICVVILIPLSLVYGYLASAMPRSGGDYVYVSRVMGPAWGMMSNFQYDHVVVLLRRCAFCFPGALWTGTILPHNGHFHRKPGLDRRRQLVRQHLGHVHLWSPADLGPDVYLLPGLKNYFRVQNILIIFAIISTVLSAVVFIGKDNAAFMAAFNHYVGPLSGKPDVANYVLTDCQGRGICPEPLLTAQHAAGYDLDLLEPVVHVLLGLYRQRGEGCPPFAALVHAGHGAPGGRGRAGHRGPGRQSGRLRVPWRVGKRRSGRAGYVIHACVHRIGLIPERQVLSWPS